MAIEISNKEFRKIISCSSNIVSNNNGGNMKNKLTDLNNHLFEQLERLNDEDLTEEQLSKEIGRAKAMTDVANSIINNAKVVLDASKFLEDSGYSLNAPQETMKLLGMNENEEQI
jgi:hypothetical protein